jgi:hypothetical protein
MLCKHASLHPVEVNTVKQIFRDPSRVILRQKEFLN